MNKLLLLPFVALLMAASPTQLPNSRNPGTKYTTTQTPEEAIPAGQRSAWCLISDPGNVDNMNFTLGTTASTTVGITLTPGDVFCDPIAGGAVYTGTVWIAAVTVVGTVTYQVVSY
jgi:hypothetical protein